MSRKSLIFCFLALAAMVVLIVAAVALLYRKDTREIPLDARYPLAYAVPSNAVMVCFLSEASSLESPVFSTFDFTNELADYMNSSDAGSIARRPFAMSVHYSGVLSPLYVFDAGAASDSPSADAVGLMEFASSHGHQSEYVNCASLVGRGVLSDRSLVLVAKTKAQLSICKSHIKERRSIMDVNGFSQAAEAAPLNVLFVSYENIKVLFEKVVQRSYFNKRFSKTASAEYSNAASFFYNFSDWGAVSLEHDNYFEFVQHYSKGSDFMSVLDHGSASVSDLSRMLPSYTRYAITLPMRDASTYLSGYSAYLESVKKKVSSSRKLIDRLGVCEVASAAFMVGGKMERVNLLKVERADTILLRGTGDKSFGKSPKVRPYAFADNVASVFGKCFRLPDESHFTFMDGWLITGSQAAVEGYASGMALSYNLKTYMADAGRSDLLADRLSSCVVYANFPKDDKWLSGLLGKEACALHNVLKGDAEYSPMVVSVFNKGGNMHTDLSVLHLQMNRSRAPKFERDTQVEVPKGPFKVVNSGTGRTNLFYQQSNNAICLKEENGKGLWGVPFKKPICGTAHNVDYYANGNKQILFGAGSELYLIDRMGRFVNGFPTDLGKEILLGPDVYDFNGVNAYNVLVLHKDNTVEMYNLHGKQPDSWKGITSKETIKSLPERLVVSGKSFWVVRTSIQTSIYPFYGGDPLTKFKGDQMFLPTAEVRVKNSTTVEAECYDGKVRAVKIK